MPQNREISSSSGKLNATLRREIVDEARREILQEWAIHNLVSGLQMDFQQAMIAHATDTGKTETKRRKGSSRSQKEQRPRKRNKPQAGAEDSDDETPGDEGANRQGPDQPFDASESDQQIMCPYFWYDCERHSRHNTEENEYRNCEGAKMNSIARLK